jgi:hypothetical protein
LVEIGASCPAPSLYLIDSRYDTSPALDEWVAIAKKYVPGAAYDWLDTLFWPSGSGEQDGRFPEPSQPDAFG